MTPSRGIAFRLILVTTLCGAAIFAAVLGSNYYRSRQLLQKELESNARNFVCASVDRVERVLAGVAKTTEGLSRALENGIHTHEALLDLLRSTVAGNPEIHGACAAFDSSASERPYAPYWYRKEHAILYYPEDSFDYLRQDWFQIAFELEKTEWTEPYYDEGGGDVLMTTCAVPFYAQRAGGRQLRGVVVADISLEWLTELVASIKVLQSGYAFLLTRNGTIVTHPDPAMIMNETIFSLAEARGDPGLRRLGQKMIRGESGFVAHTDTYGTRSRLYYAPIPTVGWTLAVVFPEHELLAQVKALSIESALLGAAGVILLAVAVILIARSITTPLHLLAQATQSIAHGDFDVALPAGRSRDEVGMLARAFEAMKHSLREYIRQLTETTAAKERIESELDIAHDIQMGLLPKIFPPFPERPEFDLYALIAPAKEVGGDFYDFFLLDDRRLGFVIADVSGKGVPAALFMAMSMTLIRSTMRQGLPPEEVLSRVNNELSRDNDGCMFVTVFCGVLEMETGTIVFANGGHNPPLHLRRDGTIAALPRGGPVVGAMPEVAYACGRLRLESGERLFLYTDGVSEAMNVDQELFSCARMKHVLAGAAGADARGAVDAMMAAVADFTGAAPQSDDITMLMIHYRESAVDRNSTRKEA